LISFDTHINGKFSKVDWVTLDPKSRSKRFPSDEVVSSQCLVICTARRLMIRVVRVDARGTRSIPSPSPTDPASVEIRTLNSEFDLRNAERSPLAQIQGAATRCERFRRRRSASNAAAMNKKPLFVPLEPRPPPSLQEHPEAEELPVTPALPAVDASPAEPASTLADPAPPLVGNFPALSPPPSAVSPPAPGAPAPPPL
jgi:hypothetical protein